MLVTSRAEFSSSKALRLSERQVVVRGLAQNVRVSSSSAASSTSCPKLEQHANVKRCSQRRNLLPTCRAILEDTRAVSMQAAAVGDFATIESALVDLAAGKFVVVLDDEDRENEGDLILAADKVTTEAIAFMVEETSGVICVGMEGEDLDRLELPLMVSSKENSDAMRTAFTVTVDLREGTTTGISASDRANTIRALADLASTAADFRKPGHIFPLRYHPGGVLVRPGHTEASVDLARLAGSTPAGVLCEVVDRRDGSMARTPYLLDFAKRNGLKCVTIAELVRYIERQNA